MAMHWTRGNRGRKRVFSRTSRNRIAMVDAELPPSQPPVSILMYHQVGRFQSPKAHRAGYCHVRRFRAQMAYLRAFRYNVISLDQALDGLFNGGELPPRSVVLTFDDGYRNFRDHAFPVLRRHGFPATVFVVADLVGKSAEWLEGDRERPPLMGPETLREVQGGGVTLGSHTSTHPRLSRLPEAERREQIFRSKAVLEDMLQNEVRHFCYPYGDYAPGIPDLVKSAGYASGLTCIRGAANTADNPFEIPRKAISYGDNLLGYYWKLNRKHARKDSNRSSQ
jgi:peptidoglycan/xylan/chitin deacetylase (PgdA/CDA1 family)